MKNKILRGITRTSLLAIMVAGSCLDSDSYIPYIIVCLALAWLALMLIVNKDRLERCF